MPRVNNAKDQEGAPLDDYRVVAISLYVRDIENLDSLVSRLRAMGHTKASRSSLIRAAIRQVDLQKVERGV